MKRVTLGGSDIEVSRICLGTMTFGNQTDEDQAHRQMDMALEAGMTFMDCAEMYPVNPVRAETVGLSEEVIGRWLARTGRKRKPAPAVLSCADSPASTWPWCTHELWLKGSLVVLSWVWR